MELMTAPLSCGNLHSFKRQNWIFASRRANQLMQMHGLTVTSLIGHPCQTVIYTNWHASKRVGVQWPLMHS